MTNRDLGPTTMDDVQWERRIPRVGGCGECWRLIDCHIIEINVQLILRPWE